MGRMFFKLMLPSGALLGGSALVWLLMYVLVQPSADLSAVVLLYGEVLIPPIVGCLAANVWLGDQCRELLMTYPTRSRRIVGWRLGWLLAYAWLAWTVLVVAAALRAQPSLAVGRVWLGGAVAQCLGLSLGGWAALQSRSVVAACVVVLACWGVAIALRGVLASSPLTSVIHPLLTYQDALHPWWWLNRLSLSIVSAGLSLLTLLALRSEERFLPSAVSED